jgi:hypothetical protein
MKRFGDTGYNDRRVPDRHPQQASAPLSDRGLYLVYQGLLNPLFFIQTFEPLHNLHLYLQTMKI